MTYLSLSSGSSGFIFFIYSPRNSPYSTSLWSECRTLALEALDLSGSLLSEKPPLDVSRGAVCRGRGEGGEALFSRPLWVAKPDGIACWVSTLSPDLSVRGYKGNWF